MGGTRKGEEGKGKGEEREGAGGEGEGEREEQVGEGAESKVAEPASGGTAERKGAKPKLAAPTSVSGSSVASTSKGPGPGKTVPMKWKSSRDTMEYLMTVHEQLYPSPKARDLKEQLQALNKGFHTREKIRKGSYLQKRELTKTQLGYSRKKKKLHEQRLAEDHSQLSAMDQLTMEADDDDAYDSEADDESDQIEQALEREKASQGMRERALALIGKLGCSNCFPSHQSEPQKEPFNKTVFTDN